MQSRKESIERQRGKERQGHVEDHGPREHVELQAGCENKAAPQRLPRPEEAPREEKYQENTARAGKRRRQTGRPFGNAESVVRRRDQPVVKDRLIQNHQEIFVWGDPIIEDQYLPGLLSISPFVGLEERGRTEFKKEGRGADQKRRAKGDAMADTEQRARLSRTDCSTKTGVDRRH